MRRVLLREFLYIQCFSDFPLLLPVCVLIVDDQQGEAPVLVEASSHAPSHILGLLYLLTHCLTEAGYLKYNSGMILVTLEEWYLLNFSVEN